MYIIDESSVNKIIQYKANMITVGSYDGSENEFIWSDFSKGPITSMTKLSFGKLTISDTPAIINPAIEFISFPVDVNDVKSMLGVDVCMLFENAYIYCMNTTNIDISNFPSIRIESSMVNATISASHYAMLGTDQRYVYLKIMNSPTLFVGSLALVNYTVVLNYESNKYGLREDALSGFRALYMALIFIGIALGILIGAIIFSVLKSKKATTKESVLVSTNL
jgi:hypothetical protein